MEERVIGGMIDDERILQDAVASNHVDSEEKTCEHFISKLDAVSQMIPSPG